MPQKMDILSTPMYLCIILIAAIQVPVIAGPSHHIFFTSCVMLCIFYLQKTVLSLFCTYVLVVGQEHLCFAIIEHVAAITIKYAPTTQHVMLHMIVEYRNLIFGI